MASAQKAKIVLHWLDKSRAQRVLWLLEESKLEYELKIHHRAVTKMAPPELKNIHPLGKAPIVTVQAEGAKDPLVLAESGAIIEYLTEHFGAHLKPTQYQQGKEGQLQGETEEWMRYRYFMHYTEGTLMPFLVMALVFNSIKTASPFFIKPISNALIGRVESLFLTPNLESNFSFLEEQVKTAPNGGGYLCGSKLTAADIIMSFPLGAAKGRSTFSKEKFPLLWSYVDRLQATESYKRAVQKIVDVEGSYDPSL